jgi:hypothetical protein
MSLWSTLCGGVLATSWGTGAAQPPTSLVASAWWSVPGRPAGALTVAYQ